MIKTTNSNIFKDLPDKSVILQIVNCEGSAETGFPGECRKRFPQWYISYKEQCDWFRRDYLESIMGSFHSFSQNDNLKICSMFAIGAVTKARPMIDFKAVEKAMRKIEQQVRRVNSDLNTNWILHVQKTNDGFFGDWQRFYELLEYFFRESPVELWIHE